MVTIQLSMLKQIKSDKLCLICVAATPKLLAKTNVGQTVTDNQINLHFEVCLFNNIKIYCLIFF